MTLRVIFSLLAASLLCSGGDVSGTGAEAAVRKADDAWAKSIAGRSVERTVAMYDTDAFMAGDAMPPARGIAEIHSMWTKFFADPNFTVTWKSESVVVSRSGKIAWSKGTWHTTGPTQAGSFVAVWRKQRNGEWKVLIDSAWFASETTGK